MNCDAGQTWRSEAPRSTCLFVGTTKSLLISCPSCLREAAGFLLLFLLLLAEVPWEPLLPLLLSDEVLPDVGA